MLALAALAALLPLLPPAAAQDATVTVGVNGLKFDPPTLNASVGSTITFLFSGAPGDHSVSQSSFAAPCSQLAGGFDSGLQAVKGGASAPFLAWNLTVATTDPIWYYCKQADPSPHCIADMVGAINPPASGSNTFDAFASAAGKLAVLPPQTSGGFGTSSLGAFATASPATASNTGSSSSSSSSSGSSSSSTGTGTPKSGAGTRRAAVTLSAGLGGVVLACAVGLFFGASVV